VLTIVIPTWNRAADLNKLLESCYPISSENRVSILVIDDGSTDDTSSICDSHKARNPNLEIFKHPKNQGYAVSFLDAIEKSKSEWILMCEDDGMVTQEEIQKILPSLTITDSDILVTNFKDKDGVYLRRFQSAKPTWSNLRHAPGIIYRREKLLLHLPYIREIMKDNMFVEHYPQVVVSMSSLNQGRVSWLDATPCAQEFENPSNIGGSVGYWHILSRARQSVGAVKLSKSKYFKKIAWPVSSSVALELSTQTIKEAVLRGVGLQNNPSQTVRSLIITSAALTILIIDICMVKSKMKFLGETN
jgi:glycosyltransferase involved in cell wall biosynthesis